ncbi:hypothetical protein [Pelobium manganitolerans]|uniref:hypothetical protein n=1 Tax=Pelobium manganitolerans TaxID=1842495 RepID=UPI003FA38179
MNKDHFKTAFLLSAFLFFGFYVQAQSINDQFKQVVEGSNNYQEYKVIKQSHINSLWKNTVDTLQRKEAKYAQIATTLNEREQALKKQHSQLAEKEKSLQASINSANEITFLGLFSIEKGNYRMLMWGFIIVLAVIATVLYFTAFAARKEARYRIKLFEDLQDEFKTYKTKANDNEKKLARALQDERNKLAEYNLL